MDLIWNAVTESEPGPLWAGLFARAWPAYQHWWRREGLEARPSQSACLDALSLHMPELVPLYQQLCALVGPDEEAHRFLSFWCPPPYLSGCSQAVWSGREPVMVRNYDYNPEAFDRLILKTAWNGRQVMGVSDGLFGLVDGVNDAGLAVSLTFGGRQEVGQGFGVPIILRYVLQTCSTAAQAAKVLSRVPTHMSYNVTVLDRARHYLTVRMAPDRAAQVTRSPVATNHQDKVEWDAHARFTATLERERFLLQRVSLHDDTENTFIAAFLKPPLYSNAFTAGFGTLYTAVYRPRKGQMEIRWPHETWAFSFDDFIPGQRTIRVAA